MTDYTVREMTKDDEGYVHDTWGRSMRHELRDMKTDDYWQWIRARRDRMLSSEGRIYVAGPDDITAWAWIAFQRIAGHSLLHYAYTRETQRKRGLLRALVAHCLGTGSEADTLDDLKVTHLTEDGRALKSRFGWRYVPFA